MLLGALKWKAWQAGLTSGDLVVAVNGLQLQQDFKERLKDFRQGQQLKLTLFRDGRLLEKSVTPTALTFTGWKIKPVERPTASQKAYYKAWLGTELPKAK